MRRGVLAALRDIPDGSDVRAVCLFYGTFGLDPPTVIVERTGRLDGDVERLHINDFQPAGVVRTRALSGPTSRMHASPAAAGRATPAATTTTRRPRNCLTIGRPSITCEVSWKFQRMRHEKFSAPNPLRRTRVTAPAATRERTTT